MSVLRPEFPDHASPFSREQERRLKVDAIVSAAAKHFNEQGFAHTRLEDVAADLGLTKTSISYYFASKEDLAEAVFVAATDFLHDAVDSALAAPGDSAARLTALLSAYAAQLEHAANGQRPHLAALRDLDALPDSLRLHIAGELSKCVAQINQAVAAWIAETGAPLGRAEPASCLILALLDWMGERQGQHRPGDDVQTDLETLNDLITHGLSASSGALAAATPLDLTPDEALAIFDRDARNRMKRKAFLKAGSRRFNQQGFGGTSLAEVAADLGVSRGAFYYHIEDKAEFLDQCLQRSLQIVERALDKADDADLAPLERVHSILAELIYRQAAGVEPLLRPGMAAVLEAPRQRRHLTRLKTIARRLGDALTEAAASGEARSLDTNLVEDILSSVVFLNGGYMLAAAKSFPGWSISTDPRTATRDYLHLLLHGLRGPQ